jgi:hypothetical protein
VRGVAGCKRYARRVDRGIAEWKRCGSFVGA